MGFLRRARIHAWRGWEPEKKQRQLDVPKHLKELIPESKLELLHKHFQTFDEDGNGLLDTKQLGKFLRSIGFNPPESRVEEIITEYDKDGNGNLSFGEFVELDRGSALPVARQLLRINPAAALLLEGDAAQWHSYCQEAVNEQDVISRAFEFFDQDDSKAISFSEFKSIMTEAGDPLSHEELDCFFKLVDSNQDGMLNFQEFVGGVLYKENVVGGRDLTQVQ